MSQKRYGRNAHTWPSRQTRSAHAAGMAAGDPSKWKTLRDEPRYGGAQGPAFISLGLIRDEAYYAFLKAHGIPSDLAGEIVPMAGYLGSHPEAMDLAETTLRELQAILQRGHVRHVIDSPERQAQALAEIQAKADDLAALIAEARSR